MVTKCKYYNDHQTACSLMIDDLVPAAVTIDGKASAKNDWGYLMDGPGSLYEYFSQQLLSKYPEIKGTVFLPIKSERYVPTDRGYDVLTRSIDETFLQFLGRLSERFEYAFHGVKHAWMDDYGNSTHEFANIDQKRAVNLIEETLNFQERTGITFTGGKFPGYRYNKQALDFIRMMNMRWWALDYDMLNKTSLKNDVQYDHTLKCTLMPSNLTGDILKTFFFRNSTRRLFGQLRKFYKITHPVDVIKHFYSNGLPITIQEHFQNETVRGTRQTPNVYDDIWSLDNIYGLLRGLDIWHATCGEIAHYYDSYIHATITTISEEEFSIKYNGLWDQMFLSIKLAQPKITHLESEKEIHGLAKKDKWVFNNIPEGAFKIL